MYVHLFVYEFVLEIDDYDYVCTVVCMMYAMYVYVENADLF